MDGCIHSSYLAVRKSRPDLNVDVNDLSRFTKVLRNPVCHPWRDRFKQKQPTQNEMSVMSRVYRAFTIVFWARARKTSFCIVGTRQLYHDYFFCFVIIHLALKKKRKKKGMGLPGSGCSFVGKLNDSQKVFVSRPSPDVAVLRKPYHILIRLASPH